MDPGVHQTKRHGRVTTRPCHFSLMSLPVILS